MKNYVSILLAKLGLRSRTEAAVLRSTAPGPGRTEPRTDLRCRWEPPDR